MKAAISVINRSMSANLSYNLVFADGMHTKIDLNSATLPEQHNFVSVYFKQKVSAIKF